MQIGSSGRMPGVIVAAPRLVYLATMSQRPAAQRFEWLSQRMTERRDRVFDSDGSSREDGPRDKSISLEALERVGQSLVGDTVQPSFDLIEPRRLGTDRDEDQDGPLVRDLVEHGSDLRHLRQGSLRHTSKLGILGYIYAIHSAFLIADIRRISSDPSLS